MLGHFFVEKMMQGLEKMIAGAHGKVALLDAAPGRYGLRAVLAGMYLAIVVMVFWSLVQDLGGSPFGKVLASAFFGVGLCIIVFTQTELFTSNVMYMAMSSFAHSTRWRDAFRLWTACYLGNMLGAIVIALLLWGAGIIDALPTNHALYLGAAHKVHQAAGVIFFKGVLANWIVCLATLIALRVDTDLARLASMVLVVFIFLYLGFEHSIANMTTFAIALLGNGSSSAGDALFISYSARREIS
ncbi:MAG TPA: formate/nitrite transporter family protein [Rhodocyclaceae bacterium]|nr:formate/nitrite transporter family protein [Rhodocyclaceae bacterium]